MREIRKYSKCGNSLTCVLKHNWDVLSFQEVCCKIPCKNTKEEEEEVEREGERQGRVWEGQGEGKGERFLKSLG